MQPPVLSPRIISPDALMNKELLGKGSLGKVFKASWYGADVAIKQIPRPSMLNSIVADINSIAKCKHPNVIALYGLCTQSKYGAFILEFLPGGSLRQLLQNKMQDISWDIRWALALEVGHGVNYLHSEDMMLGSLKSTSILLTENLHAKIGNFGMDNIKRKFDIFAEDGPDPLNWRPPESFTRDGYKKTKAMDVYSYGMVLWEIASRQIPFARAPDTSTLIDWLKKGEKETIPVDCPLGFDVVISHAWQAAGQRPLIQELVSDLIKAKPPAILPLAISPVDTSLPGEQNFRDGMAFFKAKQYVEAIFCFEKSAVAYPPACLYLYRIYTEGLGVSPDRLKINLWSQQVAGFKDWFMKEAETGKSGAQFHLGLCYEHGLGVPKDIQTAIDYYKRALDQ